MLSHRRTYEMLENGHSVSEVANKRGLKESTIYEHIAKLIVDGHYTETDISNVYIAEKSLHLIRSTISKMKRIKSPGDVKRELPNEIGYGQVKIVLALDRPKCLDYETKNEGRYQLLPWFSKTCGDYGGINANGWPCGLSAGSYRSGYNNGRCQYHKNQDPSSRNFFRRLLLKIQRLIQLVGISEVESEEPSPGTRIFSISVLVLIILGILLAFL